MLRELFPRWLNYAVVIIFVLNLGAIYSRPPTMAAAYFIST